MRWTGSSRQRHLADALAAATLAAVAVASARLEDIDPASGVTRDFGSVAVLLILGMTLPLALRRVGPRAVVVVTVAASATAPILGYPVGIGPFGAVFALHSLAFSTTSRTTLLLGLPASLVLLSGLIAAPGPINLAALVGNGLFIAFALAAGLLLRVRNDQRAALVAQNIELEAARRAQVQAAVTEERMRIAREVHDAVGHSLVAIMLQARTGQRRVHRDPAYAEQALTEIEALAQQALDETRTAVATIRDVDGDPGHAMRLAELPHLVQSMRAVDLEIELNVEPETGDVDVEQERTAYRIVQEALNNVAKHGRPGRACVRISSEAHGIRIEVTSEGARGPTASGGSGIAGMRERAELLGGSLSAGPTASGWQVCAHLPASSQRTASVP